MTEIEPGEVIFETKYCTIREQSEGRVSIQVGDERGTMVDKEELTEALSGSLEGSK